MTKETPTVFPETTVLLPKRPPGERSLSNEHGVSDSEAVRLIAVLLNSAAWIAPIDPDEVIGGVVNEATTMSLPLKFFVMASAFPDPSAPHAMGVDQVLLKPEQEVAVPPPVPLPEPTPN